MAQALATDAELTAAIPAVAGVSSTVRAFYLDMAGTMIDLAAWGTKASFGHILLAAHCLAATQSGVAGSGGPVTSRSIGALSASYAAPQSLLSDGSLGTTSYGRQYLELRASLPLFPIASRGAVLPS